MSHHFILTVTVKFKRLAILRVGKDTEQLQLSSLLVGVYNWQTTLKNSWAVSYTVKYIFTIQSSNSTPLGIHPKEKHVHEKTSTQMFLAALPNIGKTTNVQQVNG